MIATVGGINTMWITAGFFGLSFLAVARAAAGGRPASRTTPPDPRGWCPASPKACDSSGTCGCLRTLGLIDLVVTALYLPMESVLFPKYFTDRHQPAQLGWALMALGVGGVAGALGYAVLSKHTRRRTAVLDRDAHLRCGDGRHRVPAAVAGDPGAVRGHRPGLRADPADLQLRDADPGAAAPARPGGRGDDGR